MFLQIVLELSGHNKVICIEIFVRPDTVALLASNSVFSLLATEISLNGYFYNFRYAFVPLNLLFILNF